ncbi:MAG: thiamine pyrophosphate-dependent enzyme [Candidatus Taylorbacteria bacterium]|nr:thiamine pyrophosphate-dependent enzyme [Candidatus Taylorbacteria bacterium]
MTFEESYSALQNIDPTKDLEERSVHVSHKGIDWISAPSLETVGLSPPQLLDLYHYMALMRRIDKEIANMSRKGMALGKHLPAMGNEATAIGASYALGKNDWVTLGIRDSGIFMVKGVPIEKIFMQACGKKDGPTNGWDGSLHMGDKDKRVIGLISHLGTMVAIATGCAFNEKYKKTGNAALALCGDGATSTGDVHEALNIASVMKLPLVLVIENNQWAFGTPNQLEFSVPTLALRALGYGPHVEGYWIDGTNILTVYATVKEALEKAKKENIISIIETVSMRYEGHSLADPFTNYVPAEQLEFWKQKDPIESYKKLLLNQSLASTSDFLGLEMAMKEQIKIAVEQTEKALPPDSTYPGSKVFVPSPKYPNELILPPRDGKKITYHEAIHEALEEALEKDPDVFLIGEDIGISDGAFKITAGFSKKFDGIEWHQWWRKKEPPTQRRIIDATLAEAGFCGLALGSCLGGLKAVVEFQYADFSSEAFKMLVNYTATQNARNMGPLHIVFRLPAGWAPNTSQYHSVNPESWFASTPGLKIVAPVTAFDAKGLFKASLYDGNPVLFLEYKHYYRRRPETLPPELNLNVPEYDYVVPLGKARIVKEGEDMTIVTYGSQLFRVLEAVAKIEKENKTSIEIVDLRTIVPYDEEAVSVSVRKTGKVLVTCEAPRTGCFGNTIVANIVRDDFSYLDGPPELVAAADTPVPFAPELEQIHLPTTEKLITAIGALLRY